MEEKCDILVNSGQGPDPGYCCSPGSGPCPMFVPSINQVEMSVTFLHLVIFSYIAISSHQLKQCSTRVQYAHVAWEQG